ncbi:MAG TPA: hypothetical protein DCZ44_03945 [Flavobacteriaceae bacterium]|nr:hypothetical protein [Flavobacteriaceae bacterium]
MKNLITFGIALLICFSTFAQTSSLSPVQLERKLFLDAKVKKSKIYLIASAAVLTGGILSLTTDDKATSVGQSAFIVGVFTTPYNLVRYGLWTRKRNKFYKKHNILRPKK